MSQECDIRLLAQGDGTIDDLVFVCHTHGCAFTLKQMTFESLCPDGLEEIEAELRMLVAPTRLWKGIGRRHRSILHRLRAAWSVFVG